MKLVAVPLMFAVLLVATPTQAQRIRGAHDNPRRSSIVDSATRAAFGVALQPTTQAGGGRILSRTGWAMVAGGGVLAALSTTDVLKTYDFSNALDIYTPGDCHGLDAGLFPASPAVRSYCDSFKKTNRGALWTGVGLAGAGITLALMGKGRPQSPFPPTQRSGGGKVLWWTGWAMAAGGGVLVALSNNVLGSASDAQRHECERYDDIPCKELSHGTLWTGIALAGAGATMAALGRTRQRSPVLLVRTRGGAAVFRRITF